MAPRVSLPGPSLWREAGRDGFYARRDEVGNDESLQRVGVLVCDWAAQQRNLYEAYDAPGSGRRGVPSGSWRIGIWVAKSEDRIFMWSDFRVDAHPSPAKRRALRLEASCRVFRAEALRKAAANLIHFRLTGQQGAGAAALVQI